MQTYRQFLNLGSAMTFAHFPVEGNRAATMWFLVDQISHPPRCAICNYELKATREGEAREWCAACHNEILRKEGRAFVPDMEGAYLV